MRASSSKLICCSLAIEIISGEKNVLMFPTENEFEVGLGAT